ncbi:hypothetical protein EMPG_15761 [Blastomyces silverae]|uniref:RING-type domain-containing protein n=1 Tax=Blastomyces silverae TaxID=2060906 RepID=A0A0H1BCI8_9EURO|nr:hypothetical protein EMPG_15761 [Blastomyces silverae]
MATLDPASGLMEIASSLTQEEIPFKLRCAICNKLAINAFRLPCCDQAICEICQASLPESCPVCAHTPLSADLCKPNKALRTTLKAFLRTEEKKREKDRPPAPQAPTAEPEPNKSVDQVNSNPVPPATTSLDQVDDAAETKGVSAAVEAANHSSDSAGTNEVTDKTEESTLQTATPDNAASNARNDQVDDEARGNSSVETGNNAIDDNTSSIPQGTSVPAQPDVDSNNTPGDLTSGQQPSGVPTHSHGSDTFGNGPGYGVNGMSGFPQAGWQGGSHYGQMMQTLPSGVQFNGMMPFQNGIGPPGMPGMGLDPMASSQGMFGGYGMNMNGMNNGMNMGMNFNAGQGMYGTWDGQSNMWNGGPDKFNANPFANRMGAEFGPNPGGYRGYNMSQNYANYPHMHQQQQYLNNDFHGQFGPSYGRGRGRGRGFFPSGRGRGGFMPGVHGSFPSSTNQASSFQPHMATNSHHQIDPVSGFANGTTAITPDSDHVKKFNDELCPGGEDDLKENQPTDDPAAVSPENAASSESTLPSGEHRDSHAPTDNGLHVDRATESGTTIQVGAVGQQGNDDNADQGNAQGSGVYINMPERSRDNVPTHPNEMLHSSPTQLSGPYSNMTSMEPRGMGVVGAPAAPRAMREGLPNVGIRNGRGFPVVRTASGPTLKHDKDQRYRSPSRSRDQSASRHRSTSRSPSRHRSRHRRRYRHRSRSLSVSSSDQSRDESRDQRRKSRRENDEQVSSRRGNRESRSRSPSVEPAKRAEHRSRREKDRKSDHKTSSSHRSRRHRSRSSSPKHRDYDASASEVNGVDSKVKSSVSDEKRDLAIRTSDHHRSSTKERTGESTTREKSGRHRDRDRARDRDRDRDRDRGRDRDKDRDKDKDKDKDKERARERESRRERERDRDRDRKRSRRDRSASPEDPDHYRRHSRRIKRGEADEKKTTDREKKSADPRESRAQEKDPHTLEREARDRERLLKEQQRREAMNADRDGRSSRRRESRQERTLGGGRHLSYKYEDEESDQARAARVELEREAARWA